MSLFKSREWWSVNLNESENYDSQCAFVSTLGKNGDQSILLGNHSGVLRLYSPNTEVTEEGILPYKASHLLLEVQLPAPILQINEGILVSGSSDKYLAVLHPRLFSVFAIKQKENQESNIGDQTVIELAYQHVLRHSAHSFVLGSFGGVRNRSFICIQSLDGLLSFYEQESFAFQIYLPSFILPYPFSYIEKIDSFLFLNGFLTLDCYSYESLASAANSNEKKVTKNWEFNLGEEITEIFTLIKNETLIVTISDRNLFGFNEHGKMMFVKRLEYKPSASYAYIVEENKNLMIIIASDEGCVNFYEYVNLKWSMRVDHVPVCMKRIFLKGLPGGIVLLTEDGLLQVVFIGTHPSLYLIPPLTQPEIDIQKATAELKLLQEKIHDNDLADIPSSKSVQVYLKVNNVVVDNDVRMCNVMVEIDPQCLVNKLQALLLVEPPLIVSNPSSTIESCSEKVFIESSVRVDGPGAIPSLAITLIVTYITNEGVATSVQKSDSLPLNLAYMEVGAVKEALYKITISSNKPVCGINQLFGEFATENLSVNVIGLKPVNSDNPVTILAAKSSQRYRVQTDSLESASLLIKILIERLKFHFRKESDFGLALLTPLPLDVYFEKIQFHHATIKEKKTLEGKLSKQTAQFRMVQKKILMNLKDVTPKSNSNLSKILKDTTESIKTSLDQLEDLEKELQLSKCCICSLSRLLLTLLELMNVKEEDMKMMRVVFFPYMEDLDDQLSEVEEIEHSIFSIQWTLDKSKLEEPRMKFELFKSHSMTNKKGWLEVQEATASFLLHTILAKSIRDQQKPTVPSLSPLQDTSKLTKHFSSVIDRVTKGSHLLEKQEFEWKENLTTIQAAYESEETSDDVIPVSCKLTNFESGVKITEKQNVQNEAIKEETGEDEDVHRRDEVHLEKPKSPSMEERKEEVKKSEEDDDDDAIWDIKMDEMRI